jgi:siderophore synthetase component
MSDTPEKPVETLTEVERLSMELARTHVKLAAANAETALARNELAGLNHRYLILQLYHKYGLSEKDGIGEQGQIIRDYIKEVPNAGK